MGLCGWGDHKEAVAGLSGKVEGQSSCGEKIKGAEVHCCKNPLNYSCLNHNCTWINILCIL